MPEISDTDYQRLLAAGHLQAPAPEPIPDPAPFDMSTILGQDVAPGTPTAPDPVQTPVADPAPQVDAAPVASPTPSTDQSQYQARIADLREREGRSADEELRLRLGAWGQQSFNKYVGEGIPEATAREWVQTMQAKEWEIQQGSRYQEQIAQEHEARISLAAELAQEHGMGIRDLLRYRDAETMTLAAEQFGTLTRGNVARDARIAELENAKNVQAAPSQTFNPPGVGVQTGIPEDLKMYGMGDAPINQNVESVLKQLGLT